jgi:DNA adenine methylase
MMIKPIIKWVGGKTQIIDKIMEKMPEEMNNYREIFVGGRSVLIRLLELVKEGKIRIKKGIYAYDLNGELIGMYKNIQKTPKELYDKIKEYIDIYNECKEVNKENKENNKKPETEEEGRKNKESYYYWMRKKYNMKSKEEKKLIDGSALFIILNKTCFRGMYRSGKNGFNVPYGNYKNPEIINLEHLQEMSELIKDVKFRNYDFEKSIIKCEENDYMYLDPPYYPDKNFKTAFVNYNEDGFNEEKHKKLFDLIKETEKNKKIKFMLSNNDVNFVKNNFINYNIESFECKRLINSKTPNSKTTEVLIKNY